MTKERIIFFVLVGLYAVAAFGCISWPPPPPPPPHHCPFEDISTGSKWIDKPNEVCMEFVAEGVVEYWILDCRNNPGCSWRLHHRSYEGERCVFLGEKTEWLVSINTLNSGQKTIKMESKAKKKNLSICYDFIQLLK